MPPPTMSLLTDLRRRPDWDPARFRRDQRAKRVRRIRRGVYSTAPEPPTAELRHAEAAQAALLVVADPDAAISHESAAVVHAIPLFRLSATPRLTVTRSAARVYPGLAVAAATLPPSHVTVVDGDRVTSVARTVVDLARADVRAGIVAADAVLAADPARAERDLDRVLARCAGWPGITQAREVVARADARSESPLESLTRWLCHDHGLVGFEPQVWFRNSSWRYRTDLASLEHGVVVECEGRVKYRVQPLPGVATDLEERVWSNSRRSGRLAELGFVVVHVTWAEVVGAPRETAARLRGALYRAASPDLVALRAASFLTSRATA